MKSHELFFCLSHKLHLYLLDLSFSYTFLARWKHRAFLCAYPTGCEPPALRVGFFCIESQLSIMNRRLPISIIAFLAFTFSMSISSTAQVDISNYDTETIYLQTRSNRYVKNGQSYPLGLFRKKLAPEMEVSPQAVVMFQQSRKNNNIAWG